ncbi:MAG: hypothetical protein ACREQ4_00295 [Candidatus Binataceae bacterium]
MEASVNLLAGRYETVVEIGGLPITICTDDYNFALMLERRYANFIGTHSKGVINLEVEIIAPSASGADDPLEVSVEHGRWLMRRGDFQAEWNPLNNRGRVRQAASPYAIDSVLRIIHSLVLTAGDGFLLHSASAIRNGRAALFSGVSGAGKTTISRLAPRDVTLLTDEISYVRMLGSQYHAFGTPFAGELGIPGENVRAPLATLYFLKQGRENRSRPLATAVAARMLLRNVLFFADDSDLVELAFARACDFVERVPVCELTFRPDASVWDLIQ